MNSFTSSYFLVQIALELRRTAERRTYWRCFASPSRSLCFLLYTYDIQHVHTSGDNNNNNNNNNHDDIYSAVIYVASHMRQFTVVPLGQSRSAPGGRQLVGQAANLTFESACIGCYRPNIRPSPCIITQP